jgi:regulatory protein
VLSEIFAPEMNYRITALTAQKRNRQRVNVFLDGEFAFGLARIVAAWLSVGMELSDEKIAQLQDQDERETAYQVALDLINYRPRTEAEIRKNLNRRGVKEEITQYVLDRLRSSHLLDDSEYARAWVENRTDFRPRSRHALAFELRQRGVETNIIEATLESVDEDEMAYQAAQRQSHKITYTEWRDFRQKMLRHLAQRGFRFETSDQATRRVWTEISEAELIKNEGAHL